MSPTRTTPLRWPFWLLIAAWVCANTPQVAAWHVIVWVKNAQHFSHQAQLRGEVASLLSVDAVPAVETVAFTAATTTETPPAPLAAGDFSVKKIVLSLADERGGLSPASTAVTWTEVGLRSGPAHVADVPYPPPRV
jgi:hypothetical protein